MSHLLEHTSETIDGKSCPQAYQKRVKAKSDEIIEAIKGYKIETDQAKKYELAHDHLKYLEEMIAQTER